MKIKKRKNSNLENRAKMDRSITFYQFSTWILKVKFCVNGFMFLIKFHTQTTLEGEERDRVKSLSSSSLERVLLANQHAALHGDSISTPLAVARIPHNQEVGRLRC